MADECSGKWIACRTKPWGWFCEIKGCGGCKELISKCPDSGLKEKIESANKS